MSMHSAVDIIGVGLKVLLVLGLEHPQAKASRDAAPLVPSCASKASIRSRSRPLWRSR